MDPELLDRTEPRVATPLAPPVPLRLLDPALDRDLTLACALVGQASSADAEVILVGDAGTHPVPLYWAACNALAARLCARYGVEILLAEEHGRVRMRIERYRAPGSSVGPEMAAPRPRRPWLRRWWAGIGAEQ